MVWEVLRREIDRAAAAPPAAEVVDVGGGTGGFAVPLAQAGHDVTVVDAEPGRAGRADPPGGRGRRRRPGPGACRATPTRLPTWCRPGGADLVLCHSVLEVVDSPAEVAAALAATLRPGGAASVIVANRAAAVLARAMGGQLDTRRRAAAPTPTAGPASGTRCAAGSTSSRPPRC